MPNRAAPLHVWEDEYVRTCPHNLHESWCPYNVAASASRTLSHHFRCAVGRTPEFAPPLEVSDLGYPPRASTAVWSSTFGLAERVSDDLQVLERVDPQGTSVHPDASGIGGHRLDTGLLRAYTICRQLHRPGRGKSSSHRCRVHSSILMLCRFPSEAKMIVTSLHRRSFALCSSRRPWFIKIAKVTSLGG